MKKKGFVLLMMVFLLLSVLPASAAEQRVFDNADLLTAEEEQNLQQFCEDAKEEYDIDFAYLTTKDTEGLSTREYGAQFYIEQNLGVGEDYSGAIFVLDMGEREGQLVTCGEAMEMITDADADAIWDEISSYFSNGDYYGGMEQLWWDVDSLCADYQTYGAEGRPKSDAFFSESPVSSGGGIAMIVLLAAAFSAVIAGVSVMSMRKACKNVHPFTDGRAYLKENGCHLRTNQDTFANTHTTMVPIPRDDDNNHHHTGGFSGGDGIDLGDIFDNIFGGGFSGGSRGGGFGRR